MMRRSPLARTEFKRKPGAAQLSRGKGIASSKTPIKTRRRKPTVAEGSKFIDACRGEECYLRVPGVCLSFGWAHRSVVDCHSNQGKHGKGGGLKAKHWFTVPGCSACHEYIDRGPAPRAEKFALWDSAYERWEPVRDRKMSNQQHLLEVRL